MAALRYSARNICGRALQLPRPRVIRPPAAVTSSPASTVEEERRLLPRLIYGGGGMPHISYGRRRFSSGAPESPINNNKHHYLPCPNPAADAKSHINIDPASLETLVQEKKDELFRLLLQMDLRSGSCEKSAEENKAMLQLLRQSRADETQHKSHSDRENFENGCAVLASIILSCILVPLECSYIFRV